VKRKHAAIVLLGLICVPASAIAGNAAASLRDFFAKGVRVGGAQAELVSVEQWPAGLADAEEIRWRMPAFRYHPERMYMIAEQGRGGHLRRWHVAVHLRWWAKAVVANTDLPARTLLNPASLARKRVNIAGHAGRWWRNAAALTGARLTRPLSAGQPVLGSYVRRSQLLRRGDRVTMVASIGGLQVRAVGKVMQAAGAGDRVLVQNILSRKVLQAIVLDATTVRITGGSRG